MSQLKLKSLTASALLLCAGTVMAQANNAGNGNVSAAPQNVLQLAATGTVEVQQDVLVIRLAATKEANDAATVQTQLKQILDAALTQAKAKAQPQQMEVRSGEFSLYPRNNKDGKITGWQGRAELILEGKDFPRISSTAGDVKDMAISSVNFDLSREARARVETEAQAKAIESFKARAKEITRSFGFSDYTLREVSVNNNSSYHAPMPYRANMAGAMMKSAASDSVPVEAGKAQVEVSVSGSVQMR